MFFHLCSLDIVLPLAKYYYVFSCWSFSWMVGDSLRSVYIIDEDLIWTILLAGVISSAQMKLPVCPSVCELIRTLPLPLLLAGGREGMWMGQALFSRVQVVFLLSMEINFFVSISAIEHCLLLLPQTNCYVFLSEFCHQGVAQNLIHRQTPNPEARDGGRGWGLLGIHF